MNLYIFAIYKLTMDLINSCKGFQWDRGNRDKNLNRSLFIVFTIRESLIRIISARDMHKKEREIYYGKV